MVVVSCPNTGILTTQNTMALVIIFSVLILFSGYIFND
jgi:hypothetical protein